MVRERKGKIMKAIVTKYIPATNTLPSRVKAKAEGVPAIVISYGKHLYPHKEAALTLCRKYGWGEDIIGGGMPDQTGEGFVFADPLVRAMRDCVPDLQHYVATHGPGPDARLARLMDALEGMK